MRESIFIMQLRGPEPPVPSSPRPSITSGTPFFVGNWLSSLSPVSTHKRMRERDPHHHHHAHTTHINIRASLPVWKLILPLLEREKEREMKHAGARRSVCCTDVRPSVHFPTNTTSTKAQMVKYRQCVNDMNVLLLSYSHWTQLINQNLDVKMWRCDCTSDCSFSDEKGETWCAFITLSFDSSFLPIAAAA